ncbi:MAG: hypothetical protein IT167_29520 [Bryobacterales bacterium]|nr:hypothetical protein [Bryobacterales bacterium]
MKVRTIRSPRFPVPRLTLAAMNAKTFTQEFTNGLPSGAEMTAGRVSLTALPQFPRGHTQDVPPRVTGSR